MNMMQADQDSTWKHLEHVMLVAVGECIQAKTFELVRLVPDADGIEQYGACH